MADTVDGIRHYQSSYCAVADKALTAGYFQVVPIAEMIIILHLLQSVMHMTGKILASRRMKFIGL